MFTLLDNCTNTNSMLYTVLTLHTDSLSYHSTHRYQNTVSLDVPLTSVPPSHLCTCVHCMAYQCPCYYCHYDRQGASCYNAITNRWLTLLSAIQVALAYIYIYIFIYLYLYFLHILTSSWKNLSHLISSCSNS